MTLFHQRRPKTRESPKGRRNSLKRLDSRKERAWIFLPVAFIFLPSGLDFPSPGFDFPSQFRAQGELSGPTELDEQ
jgi:hypothetical protein